MVFPQMMNCIKSSDDCYFYYYSSCTKGEECPFRHCQLALGTETVCSLWKEGRCFRSNCKFRHMESRIDRKSIQCYWENQPGGCRKPHCVFFHKRPKTTLISTDENKLILPVSGGTPAPSTAASNNKVDNISSASNSQSEKVAEETDEGIHSPVEPFVVSFDENEESDSESVSSTPVKASDAKPINSDSAKARLLSKLNGKVAEKNLDFEIKSLEQIRLEKIHKESANIYKTDDLPGNDYYFEGDYCVGESVYSGIIENNYVEKKIYLENQSDELVGKKEVLEVKPSSEFISVSSENSVDSATPSQNKDVSQTSLRKNMDLRTFLSQTKKKLANNSKSHLDFKIKTLDEIRKEKKGKKEDEETNGTQLSAPPLNIVQKTSPAAFKKLKIYRKPSESTVNIINAKRKNSSPETSQNKHLKVESLESEPVDQKYQPKTETENMLPFLHLPSQSSQNLKREDKTSDMPHHTRECKIDRVSPSSRDSFADSCASLLSAEKLDEDMVEEGAKLENIQSKSCERDCPEGSATNGSSKRDSVNRSISIDDIDNFLDDTDVNMGDLTDATVDDVEDDIMLQINEFLDN